jgi:transposase
LIGAQDSARRTREAVGLVYLRHTTIKKNGKQHVYWRLVQSVRVGRRVRQKTVAMLGKLSAEGRRKARAFADHLTGRRTHPSLFEPPEPTVDSAAMIRVKDVRLERSRRFGDVFVGVALWHVLQFDKLFHRLMRRGNEDVPWSSLVAAMVICRLCNPSSELHMAEVLFRQTALDDLLGIPEEKVNDDRLYRGLDELLPHKEAVEKHVRSRLGELFKIDYDLLIYDVTSTYFEGLALRNPQAKRGYSRDHRPDCKQVCIALVVTREGIPLGYEVFDGNRADVTTVKEIVETIEMRFGVANRIWVMDRGMASEANLAWLRATGRRYLIGALKSELRRCEQRIIEEQDWNRIREDVEVKVFPGENGVETYVLCRSETRREKDKAILERFATRLKNRLESLQRRLQKAKSPVDRDRVSQQIGRIMARNSRAAKKFTVFVRESKTLASGLELVVQENADWSKWIERASGCYLLRSNVSGWSEQELWQTYIQLTQAEAAFRIQKSELEIRPIWHHREDRVQAHIFVCFLAYVLWKTLEKWQAHANLGNSPRTILDELSAVQSADVILPTTDGRELRVRCVVRPEQAQAHLLDRLGIELPKRLRIPKGVQEAGM